jgi:hypothetical protein
MVIWWASSVRAALTQSCASPSLPASRPAQTRPAQGQRRRPPVVARSMEEWCRLMLTKMLLLLMSLSSEPPMRRLASMVSRRRRPRGPRVLPLSKAE